MDKRQKKTADEALLEACDALGEICDHIKKKVRDTHGGGGHGIKKE